MRMVVLTYSRLHSPSFHRYRCVVATLFALSAASGCSLQDFDYLSGGGASATSSSVGAGTHSGGTAVTATNAGGGAANLGGSAPSDSTTSTQGGATATTSGGATQGGFTASDGGTQTGGSATGGASVGPCPMYVGTGGSVVKPPSNDFEISTTGWATVAESTAAIGLVSGTDACEGSSYLRCLGTGRSQNWDGPAINLLPYLEQGHKYMVTLAARFNPQDPPDAPASLRFTQVLACADSSITPLYTTIQDSVVLAAWTRYTGTLGTALSGCSALRAIGVYLESDASTAAKSIDVDDFQLIDVTVPTTGTGGATGAGGTAGAGGASQTGGSAALGGTLGAGGAHETGGAAAAGGAGDAG